MTTIFAATFERTLDNLLVTYGREVARGTKLQAWLFNDVASRKAAEERLAAFGVEARLHSAYKPLLHFFLEEVDRRDLRLVVIGYPQHENAAQNRFLLEAYPLAAMVGDAEIRFKGGSSTALTYDVALTFSDGRQEKHVVFAPNRIHADFIGETQLSPTGWIRVDGFGSLHDGHLETDYEQLFAGAMRAIVDHAWGDREPYFEELNIRVGLPIADLRLPVGEETVSLLEALHEEFYFSLLEVFQKRSDRPIGDRGLQPGQIVPEVALAAGDPAVIVETRPLQQSDSEAAPQRLQTAEAPLTLAQIHAELAAINGDAFTATSRAGRTVRARYRQGTDAAVMISGGQHANETSGIVGALRAAQVLATRPGAHFTISPLENPDGYAVHQRLRADNPAHMHHAARYTALGDDLEYRTGAALHEREIRLQAERLSGAQLHLNLHGYPAHEWTRPLSGYVPRGFATWTLPKGFLLILRHHAGWEGRAEHLLEAVTGRLQAVPELLAFNSRQIASCETYAGEIGLRMVNGFACMISCDERHVAPLTLITEYPDETIYGAAFVAGHTAQMQTVLAAYDAFQQMMAVF
ncbi:peptidase M14 [Ensifer sp. MJa1]|uniref:peptidase M14 n=1 Tax=Ensifer sp. MJa1 TaxID=2919888 RepID=UPI00300931BD